MEAMVFPVSGRRSSRRVATVALASLGLLVAAGVGLVAQSKRDFNVSARKYSFAISGADGAEIRVTQDDLVRVTFAAEDIPHSFTFLGNNPYRIDRRAEPGKPIMFNFRADTPGTFEIGCSLTIDPRCQREMRAKLIVEPK
jgi:heme/copper-type cytochrome/quinol oxidase subunit 2